MAKTSSAKKANRVSSRKRVFNIRTKKTMREAIKLTATTALAKKVAEVGDSLANTYKAIDKAAKRGIIKKNTAARMKSRASRAVAKATTK
jgi:small subunit ribosomal protein S20